MPPKLTTRPPSENSRTVVVVDDEADELAKLVACVETAGWAARSFSTSDAAVAWLAAASAPPRAIVSDIRLFGSRFDGIELVYYARRKLGRVPAYLVSGSIHTRTSSLALLPEIGSGVMVRLRATVGPEQIRSFVELAPTVRELDSPHAFLWADRIHALASARDLNEIERSIATLAVAGCENAEIATRLGRGDNAIKWWNKQVLRKTGHASLEDLARAITGLGREDRLQPTPEG